jgi:hypothetical protein
MPRLIGISIVPAGGTTSAGREPQSSIRVQPLEATAVISTPNNSDACRSIGPSAERSQPDTAHAIASRLAGAHNDGTAPV